METIRCETSNDGERRQGAVIPNCRKTLGAYCRLSVILCFVVSSGAALAQGVAIGESGNPTANANAILDLQSASGTRGFLLPQLSAVPIATPNATAKGLMFYNTASHRLSFWNETAWLEVASLSGTETFTNKTLTSPTLTSAILGTPSSGTLTNCTGLPLATGVTGQLAIANGGTGQSTKGAAFDALSPMSALGDVIYGGASGTGTRLAGNTSTTRYALTQTGDGVNSATPVWVPLGLSGIRVMTTADNGTNYTVPADVTVIVVQAVGAGGGGAGGVTTGSNVSLGGGGGGGGCVTKRFSVIAGASYTFTVGSGGAGGVGGANGVDGTATTFNGPSTVTADFGRGGVTLAGGATVATGAGGVGGTPGTSGDINLPGNEGGAGGRFSATTGMSGTGGSSFCGSQSAGVFVTANAATNGITGGNYGSGGSGGIANRTAGGAKSANGGNGADGVIIIMEYK